MLRSSRKSREAAGAAENMVKRVKGLARTLVLSLHARLGCRLPHQHPLHYWIPDFAATSLNRYSVGDDGKTAEQLRTGRGWHRPATAFGETVLAKKLQTTVAKRDLES
eukprot:2136222-Amphidinium_carterae.2